MSYLVQNISGKVVSMMPKQIGHISATAPYSDWAIGQIDWVDDIFYPQYAAQSSVFTVLAGPSVAAGFTPTTAANAVTAFSTGGQTNATALTASINRVSVVAAAGDSVKLPAASAGTIVIVINDAALPMQVFGAGTDTINDVATATGVSQMQQSVVIYTATATGNWMAEGLGNGYSGSLPTASATNGITAFATGGQASAVLLNSVINRVTTVGTAGDSVKLPPAVAGLMLVVTNAAAANSMNLFPNTGDQINALGANAAFAIVAGKTAQLSCAVAGQWHAVLSA
jgi:hypothetical protein